MAITANHIHNGHSTHHHDHVMQPVSFKPMNNRVSNPVKPIPTPLTLTVTSFPIALHPKIKPPENSTKSAYSTNTINDLCFPRGSRAKVTLTQLDDVHDVADDAQHPHSPSDQKIFFHSLNF